MQSYDVMFWAGGFLDAVAMLSTIRRGGMMSINRSKLKDHLLWEEVCLAELVYANTFWGISANRQSEGQDGVNLIP